MSRRVSVIGLGKLGASMAAGIASRGHDVIGVDISQAAVDAVNQGRAPVQETGLEDLIAANRVDGCARRKSHAEAVLNSDISFVIVPTPSDERGAFKLQYAAYAFRRNRARARKETGLSHGGVDEHRAPGRVAIRAAADTRTVVGKAVRRRIRFLLQPGVRRARQRHP